LGDRACLRLIVAHLGTHRDSKVVPGVDGGQGKQQRNQLLFVEARSCALEDRVGHEEPTEQGRDLNQLLSCEAVLLEHTAEDMQRYAIKHGGLRRYLATGEEYNAPLRGLELLVGHRNVNATFTVRDIL
jgi:hypothetical protein